MASPLLPLVLLIAASSLFMVVFAAPPAIATVSASPQLGEGQVNDEETEEGTFQTAPTTANEQLNRRRKRGTRI
jgi:hypothetical protein